MNKHLLTALMSATLLMPMASKANDHIDHNDHHHNHNIGDDIVPNGVTGDHLHEKGSLMLSYQFMQMDMGGNLNGTNDLSPRDVLSFNNPNGGPANLRVVPTDMRMNMHMFGGMFGVTDWLTTMVMFNYLDNDMDHMTFNPGGSYIGDFTTESKGFGDTEVSGIFPVLIRGSHNLNGQVGISLPTGSIDETDEVLSPMGTRPILRLPYAMQLGSGTYDLKPGLTYTYNDNKWSYGAAYNARIHMGRNDEGYTRGDWHKVTAWMGRNINENIGVSGSVMAKSEGKIDGKDTEITAPVQTADPDNYGGEKIHLGLNMGWQFYQDNVLKLGLSIPVYQNLNGPQLKDDYNFSLKWQKTF